MANHTKQHTLWLLAAMAAPLAHFTGSGWAMTALAAAAILPLTLIPKRWEGMSKPMAVLQSLWMGAVAGLLLKNSAVYWPSDNDLAVPLTLLALAALTGSGTAPRIGAVLAFCMGLLAIPLAVRGAAELELRWLTPELTAWPVGLSLVLLLPNLSAGKGRSVGTVGLLAVGLAALVQGTISLDIARRVPDPFYQTSRTLGYLEPVAAAGMTLGWYALASYLFASAARAAGGGAIANILPTAAALVTVLWGGEVGWLWTGISAFLWVLVPLFEKMKKFQKR